MTVAASTVVTFGAGTSATVKVLIAPSSIEVGTNITVSIFSASTYELISPYDNANKQPGGAAQEFDEDVDINDTATVTTNFPVDTVESATYVAPLVDLETRTVTQSAGSPATVDIVNSVVSLDGTNLLGTIRLAYTTYADQTWMINGFPSAGQHVVFYRKVGDTDWTSLTFAVGTGNPSDRSQPSIVTVQAKDFCTDLPIEGATVFVDNASVGTTDINGKAVVGLMSPGAHSVKIQATGYIATDGDDLTNDSFQI